MQRPPTWVAVAVAASEAVVVADGVAVAADVVTAADAGTSTGPIISPLGTGH